MTNKCSWPDCLEKPVQTIKLPYTNQNPEVNLCQHHYDLHQTADQCWEKIKNTNGYNETNIIFHDSSISIFREALLSYSMGLNATVALLCRASMESAMHAYISSDNPKYENLPTTGIFIRTFNHNYACDNIRLTDLINYLKKNNVLVNMNNIDYKINVVKNTGDFVAHHSERFWKNANKNNSNNIPLKLWVSDDEAKKSLIHTSEIISELINKYYNDTKP